MPPANILFDHIDRVSHKLERIKSSFKMDDVKSIAASSKGSFRKPEESAVADGGNDAFRTDSNTNSSDYMKDIDQFLLDNDKN